MKRKRDIPHSSHTFLHRQGLKIMPSENFLNKFKEEYNLAYKNSKHKECNIDDETAIFFIISFFEAIIYCLDFGFDVHFGHIVIFKNKITDYVNNVKRIVGRIRENVKKITFRLYSKSRLTMVKNANKDNEEYQEYLERKSQKYKDIKKYYKEFYGKQDEWWTND